MSCGLIFPNTTGSLPYLPSSLARPSELYRPMPKNTSALNMSGVWDWITWCVLGRIGCRFYPGVVIPALRARRSKSARLLMDLYLFSSRGISLKHPRLHPKRHCSGNLFPHHRQAQNQKSTPSPLQTIPGAANSGISWIKGQGGDKISEH